MDMYFEQTERGEQLVVRGRALNELEKLAARFEELTGADLDGMTDEELGRLDDALSTIKILIAADATFPFRHPESCGRSVKECQG